MIHVIIRRSLCEIVNFIWESEEQNKEERGKKLSKITFGNEYDASSIKTYS
jgi:hypothetical protein